MEGYPWFKFYAAEWLGKSEHRLLDAEQRGYLIQLYAEYWLSGSIPSNPELLWKLAGAESRERFEARSAQVLANFISDGDTLVTRWLINQSAMKRRESSIRREMGKKGAAARKRNQKALLSDSGQADATAEREVEREQEREKEQRTNQSKTPTLRSIPNSKELEEAAEREWEERKRRERAKVELLRSKGIV